MRPWYLDDASNRQIKVLKFFNQWTGNHLSKGEASRLITGIFMIPDNRELWMKYVFLTGDESQDSPDLQPFNPIELETVTVPPEWKPHASKIKKKSGFERERLLEMATDILKEGVPFDDPVPSIEYPGKNFCFTGKFQFGSRAKCVEAITRMGACALDNVTVETNYLIVGGDLSPAWSHESYGTKIEKALMYKLEGRPIALVIEEEWVKTIKNIQQETK
jgi:NAD-dependent DNA ligase